MNLTKTFIFFLAIFLLNACSQNPINNNRAPASLKTIEAKDDSRFKYLDKVRSFDQKQVTIMEPLYDDYKNINTGTQINFKSTYNLNIPLKSENEVIFNNNSFYYQHTNVPNWYENSSQYLGDPKEVQLKGVHIPFSLFSN